MQIHRQRYSARTTPSYREGLTLTQPTGVARRAPVADVGINQRYAVAVKQVNSVIAVCFIIPHSVADRTVCNEDAIAAVVR